MLSPHSEGSPHARYKEAWELLDSRKHGFRVTKAAADTTARKRRRPNQNGAAGDPRC
jgi:hypothetical protein